MRHDPWGDPGSGRPLREWARELKERQAQLLQREAALERRRREIYRRRRELAERRRRLLEGRSRQPSPASHPYFRQARRRLRLGVGGDWQAAHLILALNVAVFLADLLMGRALLVAGAKFGPAIWRGELHRLVTPIFLHVDIFHLLMNGYAIYLLGPMLERALGPQRFLTLYLLGGLGGTAASLYFSPFSYSVGASGAVFGFFGYLLFTRWRSPFTIPPHLNQWLTTILVLNLVITLMPGTRIDIWGHFGGLGGGMLAGLIVGLPGSRHWPLASGDPRQVWPAVAALAAFAGFVALSVQPPF